MKRFPTASPVANSVRALLQRLISLLFVYPRTFDVRIYRFLLLFGAVGFGTVGLGTVGFGTVGTSWGQVVSYSVRTEGGVESWPIPNLRPDQHNVLWKSKLREYYQNSGYFEATIDSVNWDSRFVFVRKGAEQSLSRAVVTIEGPTIDIDPDWLEERRTMSSHALEGFLGELLGLTSSAGYLSATAHILEFKKRDSEWEAHVELKTGRLYVVESVRLEGDSRTKTDFAAKLAKIQIGALVSEVNLARAQAELLSAGLHLRVGLPRFELVSDSTAIVVIPVEPRSPGFFDLSAGYLPTSGGAAAGVGSGSGSPSGSSINQFQPSGKGSQFVGSGHITLLNAFGRGRAFSAQIDRLPNQSSGVLVSFREPSLKNWPVSVEGRFEGYQQDSTYSSTKVALGLGLEVQSNFEVGIEVNRESAKPLQAGLSLRDNQQRIATSSGSYFGVETKLLGLDSPASPRRGYYFAAKVESGVRKRTTRGIVGIDTLQIVSSENQERVSMEARTYWTLRDKWTVVLGFEGRFIFAKNLDESELVPLGGATSLRGYNENQFRGRSAARFLSEIRMYADPRTYGFVFYDLGALESQPSTTLKSTTTWYPGFGIGFAFDSAIGPVSISYALNSQDKLGSGRIHLGLSFGL